MLQNRGTLVEIRKVPRPNDNMDRKMDTWDSLKLLKVAFVSGALGNLDKIEDTLS